MKPRQFWSAEKEMGLACCPVLSHVGIYKMNNILQTSDAHLVI
jgi:hypothetical protein